MKLVRLALVLIAALVATACVRSVDAPDAPEAHSDHVKTLYYCPMHPGYTSDKPGDCPICSMKLVLRPEAGNAPAQGVDFSPQRQQLLGTKWAVVERRSASTTRRLPGRIAIDERRIAHVHARVNGFIEHVSVDYVGASVVRGQALLEMSSPEVLATEREYLAALASARSLNDSDYAFARADATALAEAALQRLRLWEVPDDELARLERSGHAARTTTLRSPTTGVVTMREAFQHARAVTPDLELFTIVDLSHVWILVAVPEADIARVHVGDAAEMRLPGDDGPPLVATVTFLAPLVDPATRSIDARLELDNPDGRLRPDGFVDVFLKDDAGDVLVVPEQAVVDAGSTQHVFVDDGNGRLIPQQVVAGRLVEGGRVILSGLSEGERVAASATFLIDSESRLSGALEAFGARTATGATTPTQSAAPAPTMPPMPGMDHGSGTP